MSYRSIKRVLGETSLERKCRFLFGACLLLLITASFWSYGMLNERVVYEQNQIKGGLLVDRVMLTRHWEKLQSKMQKDDSEDYLLMMKDITEKISKQTFECRFIW